MDYKKLITAKDLSRHLNVAENTLAKWRIRGEGPKFIRVQRRISYHPDDVLAWLAQNTFSSTTEADAMKSGNWAPF